MPGGSTVTSSVEQEGGGQASSSRATSAGSVQRPSAVQPHVGPAVDQLEPPPLSAAAALEAQKQVHQRDALQSEATADP